MALHETIEQTVTGLGYDLVEIERTSGGLLRVTIDMPYMPEQAGWVEQFINAEDCEKVTRQLQFVLEVEGAQYARPKPGQKVSKKKIPAPLQALGFTLDEISQARLAPVVDFKGRKPKSVADRPIEN